MRQIFPEKNPTYPWYHTAIFKDPTVSFRPSKKQFDKKHESNIKDNVSQLPNTPPPRSSRAMSPRTVLDNFNSWRTVDPQFNCGKQRASSASKKLSDSSSLKKSNLKEFIEHTPTESFPKKSRKSVERQGKLIDNNTTSLSNSLASPRITQAYSSRTPVKEAPQERNSSKKSTKKSQTYRKSQIAGLSGSTKKELPPKKPRIKTEHYSQVDSLPGSYTLTPEKPKRPNHLKHLARNSLSTPQQELVKGKKETTPRRVKAPSPGKEQWRSGEQKETTPRRVKAPSPGKEQWRSSYDILKQAISSITF